MSKEKKLKYEPPELLPINQLNEGYGQTSCHNGTYASNCDIGNNATASCNQGNSVSSECGPGTDAGAACNNGDIPQTSCGAGTGGA